MAMAAPDLVHQKIATHAVSRPSSPAVLSVNGSTLTYKELTDQARYVQGVLSSLGIWPNDIVAAILPDGPASVPVMLGTSGCCAYAPINRNVPESEFVRALGRLRPKAVFCERSMADVVSMHGITPLIVKEIGCGQVEIEGYDRSVALGSMLCPPDPGQIALILQTSGTTGEARRVMMSHRMIAHGAWKFGEVYQFTSRDRSMVVTPLTHTLGLFTGVIAMLYAGASAVVAPEFEPSRFVGWWQSTQPTVFSAVSAIYQSIIEMVQRTGVELYTPRLIRHAACPISERSRQQVEELFRRPLHLMYAMTEAVGMFGTPLNEKTPAGSCGKSFCGEARVVDRATGLSAGPGVRGEVQTRGPHLFSGYHEDPAATQAAMKDGWLCSGDEGYFDEDGNLFLTGRYKDVIIRGGENIMPLEVDTVLASHPAVKEALTFAVPCERVGEEVAAAVVLRAGSSGQAQDLQSYAAARLSAYKVPRQIVFVDKLPLNPNGKPDRRACRGLIESKPATVQTIRRSPVQAPAAANASESVVSGIWSDLLGFPVSRDDRFMDCGGTSIQALTMLSQVAIAFGLRHLSPALLWRAPSLSEFSAAVELEGERHEGVFEIDNSGTGRPIVWIAPDVAQHKLWDSLRGWRPIHGITLPEGLWTGGPPSIEHTARHCAQAIRKAFAVKAGSYAGITLIGWCASGVVAFETARQLHLDDPAGPTSDVVILDGHDLLHHPDWSPMVHASRLAGLALFKVSQLRGRSMKTALGALHRFAASTKSDTACAAPDLRMVIRQAFRSYRPSEPYPGALHHVLAEQRPKGHYRHPQTVWGPYVSGTHDWIEIPGDHQSIFMPPNSHKLVAALRQFDLTNTEENRMSADRFTSASVPGAA